MPTFTPPDYEVLNPKNRPDTGILRFKHSRGWTVLITDGAATPTPGIASPSPAAVAASTSAFVGGHVYTVTSGERTILESAGYTVT